ncbi:MAG: hypothetical protein EWV80_15585 [Microcystis aeruginosa Ma_QC_B_20070730_S2]|uniref:Uncharacterized protein n=1 Tax=Microcystis aeruginosa Ma_QC_B_20070730_S2 TaxID=2486256 RepID=A0A552DHE6_MICAE|nr:MAG: hypothetical protein EWV80_15585 [Microcystis aeruginosa Ma_QC_B_20070730_S2]
MNGFEGTSPSSLFERFLLSSGQVLRFRRLGRLFREGLKLSVPENGFTVSKVVMPRLARR